MCGRRAHRRRLRGSTIDWSDPKPRSKCRSLGTTSPSSSLDDHRRSIGRSSDWRSKAGCPSWSVPAAAGWSSRVPGWSASPLWLRSITRSPAVGWPTRTAGWACFTKESCVAAAWRYGREPRKHCHHGARRIRCIGCASARCRPGRSLTRTVSFAGWRKRAASGPSRWLGGRTWCVHLGSGWRRHSIATTWVG